jgi:hypothetical protein
MENPDEGVRVRKHHQHSASHDEAHQLDGSGAPITTFTVRLISDDRVWVVAYRLLLIVCISACISMERRTASIADPVDLASKRGLT